MKWMFVAATAMGLIASIPASAQILGGGGGLGGGLGGTLGGVTGRVGGTIERVPATTDTVTRARARADRQARRPSTADINRRGERRILASGSASADGELAITRSRLNTRGAVAATSRGLRRAAPTASGVQVFVRQGAIGAPVGIPRVVVPAFPVYSASHYYGPGAVFVDRAYVHTYFDDQYQDLETSLRGTGATVTRRGNDLIVALPADVTFAFDKSDIRPRFYGVLSAFAQTLNDYPGTDVEVIGHTDAVGSDGYNLGLSERRGRSVADFLAARRVEPARLVVEAMGESEPVASNATVDGRAANRRVELIVHPRAG